MTPLKADPSAGAFATGAEFDVLLVVAVLTEELVVASFLLQLEIKPTNKISVNNWKMFERIL